MPRPPRLPNVPDSPPSRHAGTVTPIRPVAGGDAGPSLLDGLCGGAWLDDQEFPPLRYHIPGVLPEGVSVLVGAPKIGKSWLVLGWGLADAAGGVALSAVRADRARPVFYLALEDGDRRMQARCRTLLPGEPIPAGFGYMTEVVPGQIIATVAEYLERYGDREPLVIIDTLGRVLPPALPGESPYSRDYRVMAQLKALAGRWPGSSLLLAHHDRKAVSADFVESVSGTNGIAGGADTVLVLTRARGERNGLLQVTGRDVSEGEYALTFDAGAWALDGTSLDAAAAAARTRRTVAGLSDRSTDVTAFVARHPAGVRTADVAAALGLGEPIARTYLARLTDAGRITRPKRGIYAPANDVTSVTNDPDSTLDLVLYGHGEHNTGVTSLRSLRRS